MILKFLGVRRFSTAPTSEFGKRIGFIGLGNIGLPMTANLVQRGFQVKAFDLNPATLEKCTEVGVKAVKTVGETASDE